MTSTRHSPLTPLSALALAIAMLGHVHAQATTDEDMQKIKLYGNVTIAQDSVSDWGPWEHFESRNLGPSILNNLPTFQPTKPDLYRPLASIPETGCAAGSLCGFGMVYEYPTNYGMERLQPQSLPPLDYHPVLMVGTVVQPGSGANEMPLFVPDMISVSTHTLSTGAGTLLYPESGHLTLYSGEGFMYQRVLDTDDRYEQYDLYIDNSGPADPATTHLSTASGYYELNDYLGGNESPREQYMKGVVGITTPGQDMAALRASAATATYDGYDYNGADVHLDVDFGKATWSGTWNQGTDGSVYRYTAPSGTTILRGEVGFTAQGTISGVNITSTSVGTNDANATVTGFVKGAFFGPNAAAVGGVADISKTRTQVVTPSSNAQAAIAAPAYTNARYVARFITARTELIRR